MSNTLKEMFTAFRMEFGEFRTTDVKDPVFLRARRSIIEDGLDGFESGKFYESYMDIASRGDDIGSITSGDPIPSLLLARCIDETLRGGLNAFVAEKARFAVYQMLEADRSAAIGWGALNLAFMMDELNAAKSEHPAPEFTRMYDTTRYLRQYALFRKIGGLLFDKAKLEPFIGEWAKEGLDRFNDYSDVHPFAIALCPPYHIWSRFIFDGDVCEVQNDGTLKRTPTGQYDPAKLAESLKPYPFLHILHEIETYPMKS